MSIYVAFFNGNGTSAEFKFNFPGLRPSEELIAAYLRMKLSWRQPCSELGCQHATLSLGECSSNQTWVGNNISLTLNDEISVEINVEGSVSVWIKQQRACFVVRVEDSNAVTGKAVLSSLAHEHRPVVLIYTKDTDASQFKHSPPHAATPRERRESRQKSKGSKNSSCQKIKHYVRFSQLELNIKVVAPSGYNMNYCSGRCRYIPAAE